MTQSKRRLAPWEFMSFLVNLTRLIVLLAQDCDQS